MHAALSISNQYVKAQIIRDLTRVGVEYVDLSESDTMDNSKFEFFIADEQLFTPEIRNYFLENPKLKCIVISAKNLGSLDFARIHVVHKPVYYLNLYSAIGFINEYTREDVLNEADFSFTAPNARILIVDDNAVNLTVARGLLEPLNMQVDTAASAAQTIEIMHNNKYDLIFMDHMMPEVDGIETTHIIRRLMPEYANIPIIALTANAIAGTRDMFIAEGMNDFVAKPIDTNDITAKLRKWLPQEKIIPLDEEEAKAKRAEDGKPRFRPVEEIDFLNVKEAMSLLNTEELFWMVLEEYYAVIEKKADSIAHHKKQRDWMNFTIEVHALKSTSRQIGADELADLAAELEKAGKEGNTDFIEENTDKAISIYRELENKLCRFFPDKEKEAVKKSCEATEIVDMLDELTQAIDDLDTLLIDEVIEKMDNYRFDKSHYEFFRQIKGAAEKGDIETCADINKQWKAEIINMYTDHF